MWLMAAATVLKTRPSQPCAGRRGGHRSRSMSKLTEPAMAAAQYSASGSRQPSATNANVHRNGSCLRKRRIQGDMMPNTIATASAM